MTQDWSSYPLPSAGKPAAVLALVALGAHPILLHGVKDGVCTCGKGVGCDAPGEHPVDARWQTADLDAAAVLARLDKRPELNIGWRMGVQPNGQRIVAIDDDGGLAQLEEELGPLPATLQQRTGSGGQHRFYLVPLSANLPKGVKVSEQVAFAPSVTPAGRYSLTHRSPIAQLPAEYLKLPAQKAEDSPTKSVDPQRARGGAAQVEVHVIRAYWQDDGGAPRLALAWPKNERGAAALTLTLQAALTTRFTQPAYLVAYQPTSKRRRLDTGVEDNEEALGQIGGCVAMTLFLADVDHHGAGAELVDAWFDNEERPKIEALRAEHPDVLVYRSRGGYRILGLLEDRFEIRTSDDAAAWSRLTMAWRAYLRRRFGIQVDPLKDWTRLQRVPHDTREEGGVPEELELIGDVERIGTWSPEPQDGDWAEADRELAPKTKPRGTSDPLPATRPPGRPTIFRKLLEAQGLLGSFDGQKWNTVCPLEREHGKPDHKGKGDDTVLYENQGEWGGIHCLHSNCGHDRRRSAKDWMGCFTPAEIEAAKRACGIEVRQTSTRKKTAQQAPAADDDFGPDPDSYDFDGPPEEDDDPPSPAQAPPEKPRRTMLLGSHFELAEMMLEDLAQGRPVAFDEDRMHRYDPTRGVWEPVDRSELIRAAKGLDGTMIVGGKKPKPFVIRSADVSGASKLATGTITQPGLFRDSNPGIAFANGYVGAAGGRLLLEPHSPENRARHAHDFEFISDPRPAKFLEYLERVHAGEPDKDDRIACMLEFVGLCMLGRGTTFNKALVLFDKMSGGTGKSQFCELAPYVVPPGASTCITPQSMCGDRGEYYRARLAGRLINVVNEMPEAEVIGAEAFKAIVDGNPIQGRQPRGEAFEFRPVAGHIFATNRLPGSSDVSRAFWDRWVCIQFNNRIRDTASDVKEYWRTMLPELGHIASLCLQHGASALERGALTIPSSHAQAKNEWMLNADQVALFIREMLSPLEVDEKERPDPLVWAKSSGVWAAYRSWAQDAGFRFKLTRPAFYDRMQMHLGKPRHCEKGSFWPHRLLEDQHQRRERYEYEHHYN